MAYREEEQVKLRRQSSKHAIALAMQGRWREAVAANISIISNFPNDVDAYNRLGRAHMELGEYSQSREAYSRAIELDPYNAIAKKNLERLSRLVEPVAGSAAGSRTAEPHHFIEEVGKAGVFNLYHLAPPEILARMVAGDRVYLKTDGAVLIIEADGGEYLGEVKPRHAQRLIKLIAGGNRYTAAIVSSAENTVRVIIREVYQDPSQAGQLSFPPKSIETPRSYVGDRIIKRELENKETAAEEPGYTITDEEGVELPIKGPLESDDDDKTEDEA
jgi:hypothetical protein